MLQGIAKFSHYQSLQLCKQPVITPATYKSAAMKASRPTPAPATRTEEAALPDWDALADAAEPEADASLLPLLPLLSELPPLFPLLLPLPLPPEPEPEDAEAVEPEPEPPVAIDAPVGDAPITMVVEEPTETWKEVRPAVPL